MQQINQQENFEVIVCGAEEDWIKLGAEPSFWNKLRNPGRHISEKFFDEYGTQMEKLRDVDEKVRQWAGNLDELLGHARKAKSQGKFLDAIFWIGKINSKLRAAAGEGKELRDLEMEHLEEFYGDGEQEIPEDYFKLSEAGLFLESGLLSEAGLMDDAKRWMTKRKLDQIYRTKLKQREMALNELLNSAGRTVGHVKSYLDRMATFRNKGDIQNYLVGLGKLSKVQSDFEGHFRKVYETNFADMAAHMRAKQKTNHRPATSVEEVEPKTLLNPTVNQLAGPTFDNTVIEYNPGLARTQKNGPIEEPEAQTLRQMEGGIPKHMPLPFNEEYKNIQPNTRIPSGETVLPEVQTRTPSGETKPSIIPPLPHVPTMPVRDSELIMENEGVDQGLPIVAPTPVQVPVEAPPKKAPKPRKPAVKKPKQKEAELIEEAILKAGHAKFYQELEKVAQTGNSYLMASMILAYSEAIDDTDEEKSLELLAVAEGILGE